MSEKYSATCWNHHTCTLYKNSDSAHRQIKDFMIHLSKCIQFALLKPSGLKIVKLICDFIQDREETVWLISIKKIQTEPQKPSHVEKRTVECNQKWNRVNLV